MSRMTGRRQAWIHWCLGHLLEPGRTVLVLGGRHELLKQLCDDLWWWVRQTKLTVERKGDLEIRVKGYGSVVFKKDDPMNLRGHAADLKLCFLPPYKYLEDAQFFDQCGEVPE